MKLILFTMPDSVPRENLLKYAEQRYPEIPPHVLREAFQSRNVKINGVRCGRDAKTEPGAVVQMYLAKDQQLQIRVLYQSDHTLVIHKPAGIPCEPGLHGERSVCEILEEQIGLKPLTVHRLDTLTEGILILALDEMTQEQLQQLFRTREVVKQYVCLVKGKPSPEHGILRDWLVKDPVHAEVRVIPCERPGAKEIITEYQVLETLDGLSRVLVTLHTGRTHQIRAHLAYSGFPVLGDDQYGDRALNRDRHARRLKLCSFRISFPPNVFPEELAGKCFETAPDF